VNHSPSLIFADDALWNVGVGRLFFGPEIVAAIGKRSTAPCGAFVSGHPGALIRVYAARTVRWTAICLSQY
jgi:hypothetical protein